MTVTFFLSGIRMTVLTLLDLVQDVEFDKEEDFCATPKPSRIKGLQIMVVFRYNLQAIQRRFGSIWTSL